MVEALLATQVHVLIPRGAMAFVNAVGPQETAWRTAVRRFSRMRIVTCLLFPRVTTSAREKMSLLDDPIQLVIVGALIFVFIMWGPKKIPELARALGQAKGEFAAGAAQKPAGLSGLATAFASASSQPVTPASSDELVETAERLGISTQGKSPQQISDAIVRRASSTADPVADRPTSTARGGRVDQNGPALIDPQESEGRRAP